MIGGDGSFPRRARRCENSVSPGRRAGDHRQRRCRHGHLHRLRHRSEHDRDAVGKVRDTASSHERTFVIEVMGAQCGMLATVLRTRVRRRLHPAPRGRVEVSRTSARRSHPASAGARSTRSSSSRRARATRSRSQRSSPACAARRCVRSCSGTSSEAVRPRVRPDPRVTDGREGGRGADRGRVRGGRGAALRGHGHVSDRGGVPAQPRTGPGSSIWPNARDLTRQGGEPRRRVATCGVSSPPATTRKECPRLLADRYPGSTCFRPLELAI